MKNLRNLIISSILNVFTFVSATYITLDMFFTTGSGNMTVSSWNTFRYFTIDSNILCGVVCLIYTIINIVNFKGGRSIPKWLTLLKSSLTAAITVTLITCIVFLGPTMGFIAIFYGKNLFLHAINPLAAMIAYMFFEEGRLNWKESLFSILPTFVYSLFYIPFILTNVWPDFYGFTFGGHVIFVPIVALIMYLVSYGLGIAESSIKNKINKKKIKLRFA